MRFAVHERSYPPVWGLPDDWFNSMVVFETAAGMEGTRSAGTKLLVTVPLPCGPWTSVILPGTSGTSVGAGVTVGPGVISVETTVVGWVVGTPVGSTVTSVVVGIIVGWVVTTVVSVVVGSVVGAAVGTAVITSFVGISVGWVVTTVVSVVVGSLVGTVVGMVVGTVVTSVVTAVVGVSAGAMITCCTLKRSVVPGSPEETVSLSAKTGTRNTDIIVHIKIKP